MKGAEERREERGRGSRRRQEGTRRLLRGQGAQSWWDASAVGLGERGSTCGTFPTEILIPTIYLRTEHLKI